LVVLLLGSAAFAQDPTESALTSAGCGKNEIQFSVKLDKKQHPVAQPETAKALVYVFRDESIDQPAIDIGSVTTRVGVDGAWVGAISTKSYFFFSVDPGDHRLCTQRQSKFKSQLKIAAATSLTAEAGKTYYFRTRTPEPPGQNEQVKLVPIDPAQAPLMISAFAHSTFVLEMPSKTQAEKPPKTQQPSKHSWF
jgi:hypothetical protein